MVNSVPILTNQDGRVRVKIATEYAHYLRSHFYKHDVVGVVTGYEDGVAIFEFSRAKPEAVQQVLSQFPLPRPIGSHAPTSPKFDGNGQMPVGFCLVTKDDWEEYRSICADLVAADYDTFLTLLNNYALTLSAMDHRPIRLMVKPQDLFRWCSARGFKVDAEGRAEYARALIDDMMKDGRL